MISTKKEELLSRVEGALEKIRPFLQADNGNIELIDITDEMTAQVRLLGACKTCSMSTMTLTAGVEESIKKEAPEIRSIETVEDQ